MLEKIKRINWTKWIEMIGVAAGALGIVAGFLDPYTGFSLASSAIALGLIAYQRQKKRDEPHSYVIVSIALGAMAMVIAMAFMIMGMGDV